MVFSATSSIEQPTRAQDTKRNEPYFEKLTGVTSQPESYVQCFVQDEYGFLWLGTEDGLYRFDGTNFRNYTIRDNHPNGVASCLIWQLMLDSKQRLWIATDGHGLSQYDAATNSFKTFRHQPDNPNSLASDFVRAIHEDTKGRIWVGTQKGLQQLLVPDNGQFEHVYGRVGQISEAKNRKLTNVWALAESATGELWIGTEGCGLASLSSDDELLTWTDSAEGIGSINNIRSLCFDSQNRLWIGTHDLGFYWFETKDKAICLPNHEVAINFRESKNRVRRIFCDSQANVWLSTQQGLAHWSCNEQQFNLHVHKPDQPNSLPSSNTSSVFLDRSGVCWVATPNGLCYWDTTRDIFAWLGMNANPALSLSGASMWCFAEEQPQKVWVGTANGLDLVSLDTGRVQHFTDVLALKDAEIMALHKDQSDCLWIGTRQHGLIQLDQGTRRTRVFSHDPLQPGSLPVNAITTIKDAGNDRLWLGTFGGGIALFDPATGQCECIQHDPQDNSSLSSNRVLTLLLAPDNILWAGTRDQGLNRINLTTGEISHFQHQYDKPRTIACNYINCLHLDSTGALWIATQTGGLNRLPVAQQKQSLAEFEHFGHQHGLLSKVVYGILTGDDGILWLSTNQGLAKMDIDNARFTHFGQEHGLQALDFNTGAFLRCSDDTLLFGGINGFNHFNALQTSSQRDVPAPTITWLSTAQQHLAGPAQINQSVGVVLSRGDRQLQLGFALPGLLVPSKQKYRYQLLGLDSVWNETSSAHSITYTNIPNGEYLLQLQAATGEGEWTTEPLTLPIKVKGSARHTRWVTIRDALIRRSVGSVALWHQRRQLQQKEEYNQRLEAEVAKRTDSLRKQNDELARLNQELAQASVTDPLTGIFNRRYFSSLVEDLLQQIDYLEPNTETNDTVKRIFFLKCDVDDLKEINDIHGHKMGDSALKYTAEILQKCCQDRETVLRWGGDEFLIAGTTAHANHVERLAERIRTCLSSTTLRAQSGTQLTLSASLGFSLFPLFPEQPERLSWMQVQNLADRAVDLAKQCGGKAWVGLDHGIAPANENIEEYIESRLDLALNSEQLVLHSSCPVVLASSSKYGDNDSSAAQLPGRNDFIRQLGATVERCSLENHKASLISLDLDNFRTVNESFGHSVGDLILFETAQRLKGLLRSSDLLYQLQADSFAILFNSLHKHDDVSEIATKLLKAIERPFLPNDEKIELTASIGIALVPKDGSGAEQLMRNLELAQGQSKRLGGKQSTFFRAQLYELAQQRRTLERELHQALHNEEFVLHYQPMYCMRTLQIKGFEALLRWKHPERGLIPPFEFIPLLEETGLIVPVGDWILKKACQQVKSLQIESGQKLFASVNLSTLQFERHGLVNYIAAVLDETRLDARDLHIEITETILMQDGNESLKTLSKMKALGLHLSIDDFGTGYSSLAYLKHFPVDTLKIDRSFIKDMHGDNNDLVIVKSILALAQELGMSTVAEGIETDDQLQELRRRDCTLAQGFLLSKPLTFSQCQQVVSDPISA